MSSEAILWLSWTVPILPMMRIFAGWIIRFLAREGCTPLEDAGDYALLLFWSLYGAVLWPLVVIVAAGVAFYHRAPRLCRWLVIRETPAMRLNQARYQTETLERELKIGPWSEIGIETGKKKSGKKKAGKKR